MNAHEEELIAEQRGAVSAQRVLLQRLDGASAAARMCGDFVIAKQVERFAPLLGIGLATIERQIAEVVS